MFDVDEGICQAVIRTAIIDSVVPFVRNNGSYALEHEDIEPKESLGGVLDVDSVPLIEI